MGEPSARLLFLLKHKHLRLYASKGHALHLESAHKHDGHIKERVHDPKMLPLSCLCPLGSIPQHLSTLSASCA